MTTTTKARRIDTRFGCKITVWRKDSDFINSRDEHITSLAQARSIARTIIGRKTGRFDVSVSQYNSGGDTWRFSMRVNG